MGRNYIVTNSNTAELGRKKKTFARAITIGPNAIRFITIIIVAVLAVVYLSQSTAGAGRSIRIQNIQTQKNDLELEKERLEAEQTRLKALKEIDNSIEKPALQPISQVDHINSGSLASL